MKTKDLQLCGILRIPQTDHVTDWMQGKVVWLLKVTTFFLTAVLLFQGCKQDDAATEPGLLASNKKNNLASVSAVGLPSGRAYYAVSFMGGATTTASTNLNGWCRISQYTFTAGTGTYGTIASKTQYWNQNFDGDQDDWKVSSTFPTVCGNNCGYVKCPKGSEPSALAGWSTNTGTYTLDLANNRVTITWVTGGIETWTMSNPTGNNVRGDSKAYTKLQYYSSNYGIQHGSGFGSNTNFSNGSAVSLATMMGPGSSPHNLNDVDVWQNPYRSLTENVVYPATSFAWWDRQECTTGVYRRKKDSSTCWANQAFTQPGCTFGDTKDYVASSSIGSQGRITYWQHEIGEHGCQYANCTNNCVSPGGGHTKVMYQVIDDNGKFHGFVGVEASLGNTSARGRFVGNFHMLFL